MKKGIEFNTHKIRVSLSELFQICEIFNVETEETLHLTNTDGFKIVIENETIRQKDCTWELKELRDNGCVVQFCNERYEILMEYLVETDWHFIECTLKITPLFHAPYHLESVLLGSWETAAASYIPFRHGQCLTHIHRVENSSFMWGVQVPVTSFEQTEGKPYTAGYHANYKIEAGEVYESEPLFWCCGKLNGQYPPTVSPRIKECSQSEIPPDLGESEAMIEMIKKLKPSCSKGIYINYNGCQGGGSYKSYTGEHFEEALDNDKTLLNTVKPLFGQFNWMSSTTWSGASDALRNLTEEDSSFPDIPQLYEFVAWCKSNNIDVSTYIPMKGIFPWGFKNGGEHMLAVPYCEKFTPWLGSCEQMEKRGYLYNCPVNRPFMEWLTKMVIAFIRKYSIKQYSSDEWLPSPRYLLPCNKDDHNHNPGDASYGYFLVRKNFFKALRKEFGNELNLNGERPQMDCGIWDALYLDSVFTLTEINCGQNGDDIRTWSRIRRYYHFYPSYIDEVAVKLGIDDTDYLMLSIFAVSNNYLFLSPPWNWSIIQKNRIRKWMNWARENVLHMSSDSIFLDDWPGKNKCDMYIRSVNGDAFIFIFNGNDSASTAFLPLTEKNGFKKDCQYHFEMVHSPSHTDLEQTDGMLVVQMPKRGAKLIKAVPQTSDQ